MLTSNTELLRRLETLNKQWNDTQSEIELRIKQRREDNDGYVIIEGKEGNYSLVSKDFLMEVLTEQIKVENMKLKKCKCGE